MPRILIVLSGLIGIAGIVLIATGAGLGIVPMIIGGVVLVGISSMVGMFTNMSR